MKIPITVAISRFLLKGVSHMKETQKSIYYITGESTVY